tara:strand:- start:329 stop:1039 length:711 start_codon:yes stop_codon:yes gene_type:complete
MKVLILGHNGMLGHMVTKFFKDKGFQCIVTDCKWPTNCFKNTICNFDGEFIINCAGAISQRTDKFEINWELPQWLDEQTKFKIIYPGTDCDDDNDEYSLSKKQASDWIKEKGKRTKIIKTNIFGPELNSSASLMSWFLSQKSEIDGYSNYLFNGNTTLTWAQYCLYLMFNWEDHNIETILNSECISKYDLLLLLKEIYKKEIKINPIDKPKRNKCLINGVQTLPLRTQILALKEFY